MKNVKKTWVVLALLGCMQVLHAQTVYLHSDNPQMKWKLKPQAEVGTDVKSLCGNGYNVSAWVDAVVPGTAFNSYVIAGLEKDPNFGDNIHQVNRDKYDCSFWYRTTFRVPADFTKELIWLNFNGVNRRAEVYLNGTLLGKLDGFMHRGHFNVTSIVNRDKENVLAVLVHMPDTPLANQGSPTYLSSGGWDWMPYVPGRLAGITGNTYLMVTGDVVMEDPWVRSELPTLQKAELSVSTDIRNASSSPKEVVVSGVIQPGNISFSKDIRVEGGTTARLSINKDDIAQLVVDQPKLWWPNGYGDPNLYTCKLTCSVDGKVSDVKEMTFGIKKYEYKMVDNVVGYPVLTFFINGQKIYLKGGNWGMSEYLLRCQGKEYETKIRLHKEMNYNMIRLWTGCVTDDEFYDYCDKYGIMVWNDFWLYVAYNDVAQPEAFKANALDKVRRLRNHPSIAIWCGANETHPAPDLDNYLREMIAKEDNNDRMYKSCSNQDGLSGSGWWGNQPPRHHFETSGSNLAFNTPAYPYGIDHGYGMRT